MGRPPHFGVPHPVSGSGSAPSRVRVGPVGSYQLLASAKIRPDLLAGVRGSCRSKGGAPTRRPRHPGWAIRRPARRRSPLPLGGLEYLTPGVVPWSSTPYHRLIRTAPKGPGDGSGGEAGHWCCASAGGKGPWSDPRQARAGWAPNGVRSVERGTPPGRRVAAPPAEWSIRDPDGGSAPFRGDRHTRTGPAEPCRGGVAWSQASTRCKV